MEASHRLFYYKTMRSIGIIRKQISRLHQCAATVQLTVIIFNCLPAYLILNTSQKCSQETEDLKRHCEIEKYRGNQWKADPHLSSSVFVFVCCQAINSLNKYPLPLQNAKEAKILQNFGDGICKILDEKLQRYYRENGKNGMDGCLL